MKVKNTTDSYVGFTVRMNPNAVIEVKDEAGNVVNTKPAKPELLAIRIPSEATVEIDDDIWNAALKTCSVRQAIRLDEEEVITGSERGNVEKHVITVPVGDGNFKRFYPVREMVESGQLQVIERAKSTLTLTQMRQKIEAAQGFEMPKDLSEDKIVAHYNRLFDF